MNFLIVKRFRPITISENFPGDKASYPSRHPSMLLKIVCHLDYSSCCTSFPNWTPHSTSAMMQKTQPKSTKTATKPTKKSTKDNQNKTKTEKQSNVLNSMLLSRAFNYTGLSSQIFFLSSFLFFFLYFWKLYSSRTEEHICFCGFLEVQQQL